MRIDEAVAVARREGMVLEDVRLALLRSELGEGPDQVEHAARALRAADAAGLLTFVAAAGRRLQQLGGSAHRPLARALLNTDIVSSTTLNRALDLGVTFLALLRSEEHTS